MEDFSSGDEQELDEKIRRADEKIAREVAEADELRREKKEKQERKAERLRQFEEWKKQCAAAAKRVEDLDLALSQEQTEATKIEDEHQRKQSALTLESKEQLKSISSDKTKVKEQIDALQMQLELLDQRAASTERNHDARLKEICSAKDNSLERSKRKQTDIARQLKLSQEALDELREPKVPRSTLDDSLSNASAVVPPRATSNILQEKRLSGLPDIQDDAGAPDTQHVPGHIAAETAGAQGVTHAFSPKDNRDLDMIDRQRSSSDGSAMPPPAALAARQSTAPFGANRSTARATIETINEPTDLPLAHSTRPIELQDTRLFEKKQRSPTAAPNTAVTTHTTATRVVGPQRLAPDAQIDLTTSSDLEDREDKVARTQQLKSSDVPGSNAHAEREYIVDSEPSILPEGPALSNTRNNDKAALTRLMKQVLSPVDQSEALKDDDEDEEDETVVILEDKIESGEAQPAQKRRHVIYGRMQNESSLHEQFSMVVYLDGRWCEVECFVCHANKPVKRNGYLLGISGLIKHIRKSHGAIKDRSAVIKFGTTPRRFSKDDIERMSKGEQPLNGDIVLYGGNENRKLKVDSDDDDAATTGGTSRVPRAEKGKPDDATLANMGAALRKDTKLSLNDARSAQNTTSRPAVGSDEQHGRHEEATSAQPRNDPDRVAPSTRDTGMTSEHKTHVAAHDIGQKRKRVADQGRKRLFTDVLHPNYPATALVRGKWYLIRCKHCQANAERYDGQVELFRGLKGLRNHVKSVHDAYATSDELNKCADLYQQLTAEEVHAITREDERPVTVEEQLGDPRMKGRLDRDCLRYPSPRRDQADTWKNTRTPDSGFRARSHSARPPRRLLTIDTDIEASPSQATAPARSERIEHFPDRGRTYRPLGSRAYDRPSSTAETDRRVVDVDADVSSNETYSPPAKRLQGIFGQFSRK